MPNAVPCSLTKTAGGVDMYVPATGTGIIGVLSLNDQAGVVNIAGDAGLTVSAPSAGTVQLTTVGNPVNASTGTFSGVLSAPTVNTTTFSSTTVSASSVSASGVLSGASASLTGSLSSLFNNSGSEVIVGVANGAVQALTQLNAFIAGRNPRRPCLITLNVSGGTDFVNGAPFSTALISVPPINSATGDVGAIVYGSADGLITTIQPGGATGARTFVVSTQNGSSATQDYTISWTALGA